MKQLFIGLIKTVGLFSFLIFGTITMIHFGVHAGNPQQDIDYASVQCKRYSESEFGKAEPIYKKMEYNLAFGRDQFYGFTMADHVQLNAATRELLQEAATGKCKIIRDKERRQAIEEFIRKSTQ